MLRRLFSMLIAGAWMIIGYFLTDLMLYGWEASLFNFVSGPIQAGASLVVALIVMPRVPVLFESVKHHTDNDEEELYAEIEEKKAAQAGSSAETNSDEENTDTENNNKSDTDKE